MGMQGVIGVYSKEGAATKSLHTLYGVQHRGQESSGVTAASDNSLRTWKGRGLVSAVLNEGYAAFSHPDDYVIIGSASGENTDTGYAPFEVKEHDRYHFSLALDGFFPDGSTLNELVVKKSILKYLAEGKEFVDAVKESMNDHRDSYYCLVIAVWDRAGPDLPRLPLPVRPGKDSPEHEHSPENAGAR